MEMQLERFSVPEKIYFKKGSLPVALRELKEVYHKKEVLILVSEMLYQGREVQQIAAALRENGLACTIAPEDVPQLYPADCILAYGADVSLEFIAKRVSELKEKPYYISVPAYLGTCAHVFSLPDGSFPDMTIIDTDIMQENPAVIKMSLMKAIRALTSDKATEYSDSMAVRAVQIFLNVPECSAEQLASAGTLAGFAFLNARASGTLRSGWEVFCAGKSGIQPDLFLEKMNAFALHF